MKGYKIRQAGYTFVLFFLSAGAVYLFGDFIIRLWFPLPKPEFTYFMFMGFPIYTAVLNTFILMIGFGFCINGFQFITSRKQVKITRGGCKKCLKDC